MKNESKRICVFLPLKTNPVTKLGEAEAGPTLRRTKSIYFDFSEVEPILSDFFTAAILLLLFLGTQEK